MMNFLKRLVCFVHHNWTPERYVASNVCRMVQICQRCNQMKWTGSNHVWQEDYVAPDSCEMTEICQRCRLYHQPTYIRHKKWRKESITVSEGERVIQKCERCGRTEVDINSWPELKGWPELEALAGTKLTVTALPVKTAKNVKGLGNIGLGAVVSYWGAIVIYLLEHIAQVTAWGADLTNAYSDDAPLGITVHMFQDNSVVWKVGIAKSSAWGGNAGAAKEEYFTVTLITTQDFEPVKLVILSRTLKIHAKPGIRNLKTALARAYVDGPAFYGYTWPGGGQYSSEVVQEETI